MKLVNLLILFEAVLLANAKVPIRNSHKRFNGSGWSYLYQTFIANEPEPVKIEKTSEIVNVEEEQSWWSYLTRVVVKISEYNTSTVFAAASQQDISNADDGSSSTFQKSISHAILQKLASGFSRPMTTTYRIIPPTDNFIKELDDELESALEQENNNQKSYSFWKFWQWDSSTNANSSSSQASYKTSTTESIPSWWRDVLALDSDENPEYVKVVTTGGSLEPPTKSWWGYLRGIFVCDDSEDVVVREAQLYNPRNDQTTPLKIISSYTFEKLRNIKGDSIRLTNLLETIRNRAVPRKQHRDADDSLTWTIIKQYVPLPNILRQFI